MKKKRAFRRSDWRVWRLGRKAGGGGEQPRVSLKRALNTKLTGN